jgi:hypothetical protein
MGETGKSLPAKERWRWAEEGQGESGSVRLCCDTRRWMAVIVRGARGGMEGNEG